MKKKNNNNNAWVYYEKFINRIFVKCHFLTEIVLERKCVNYLIAYNIQAYTTLLTILKAKGSPIKI